MKGIRYHRYGGPEVLELAEVPEPHPGPGQIRIAVHAAGVNGMDWKVRAGHLRDFAPVTFPAGTGLDAAGIVDKVGPGVEDVEIGTAVFGTGARTYAEYAVLTAWANKPDQLGFAEAAGFGVPVATAQRILDQLDVVAGQTILISGASGGVGSAMVQFATARGARVIGTASAANHAYLERLGAIPTVYGDGLVDRVRALTGDGVDAAFDIAGSGVIPELATVTGNAAKVLSIADFSAGEHGAQVSSGGGDRRAALAEAARLVEAGALHIPVASTFDLAQAADAQTTNETGHVAGRTVIVVRQER
ncbi:NADP-dependent oxidoreductase [Amycolatopsis jiangsuensis]|uniref:NADPH:quinone reductase-like Zn-dependent oxidoreductase n=1 Tax=Amycolatopsis jiangsuensis TaxID=1181879 RepID=A0A840IZW3_9PSEU|nr:NADP-dependent oxidoreductase [Amycolatopsis jiangsuensis]MBB4688206.1 NADPH:quinone reductase-like Zn-dependent oxidoreductase [Amycolatopsis jiangsuensis]